MIKKNSLKKNHITTVIEKAKPALAAAGYKFVKTKLEFHKTEGEFKWTFSLSKIT